MKFGDPVTNVCASERNRHGYFVRRKKDTIEMTDGKGWFGDVMKRSVFPGHLDNNECKRLWEPIWESIYGKQQQGRKS